MVGPDLVLTCSHVIGGLEDPKGGCARFDLKVAADGSPASPGRGVQFADSWLVARSTPASSKEELSELGPGVAALDYALVRLAEPVGDQAIGQRPADGESDRRGWYDLTAEPRKFDQAAPLMIVGHPLGRPLQLSYANPAGAGLTPTGSRVRYQTNSEPGSSGSPVFDGHWRPVALHQAAGPGIGDLVVADGRFNQGVPLHLIAAAVATQPVWR
jgi:hypothetical protein